MPDIQSDDQVLIQVKSVGVCGSEIHAFHGTHPYRKAPVILGHEAAGAVLSAGKAVRGFKVGDRVIVDPQWTCGECAYCRAGDLNLCPSKKVLGTPAWPGAFGEYIIAPEKSVFSLPHNLSYAQGSLIEPLTVAVHVARQANLVVGESVAILGTGSVGGLLAGVCHVQGAEPIITADIHQHCLDAARERLGATHDFLLPDDNLVDEVKALTGGEGVDVVFVTADDTLLVNRAVEMAKRRGRIVLVALMTTSPLQLTAYEIIGKELHIVGSSMSNHDDVRKAIELAASDQVDIEAIATHLLPIEEAQRGVELADTKDDGAIKVILSFS
ncbi:MAG: alcohol dehydrogenase catalytic domain-containing protein [Anaerolineae bacterium]